MANETGIANAALTLLGAERIAVITEDTENARKVLAIKDTVRKAVLRKAFWKFALVEIALARKTEVPVLDGYTSIFQLPPDYIRMKTTSLPEGTGYRIKGRRVYCNAVTLSIEYVADIVDPNEWDAGFTEAYIMALAEGLAYSITTNATMADGVSKKARLALNEGRSVNSQEDTPEKPRQGSWIRSRSA